MKHPIFTLFLLFAVGVLGTAQGTEKTLVSSINPQGQTRIMLALNDNVEVARCNEPFIQVQTTVRLANSSEAVLKSLATAGRYRLSTKVTANGLELAAPALQKQVTLVGVALVEEIQYYLLVPNGLDIQYTGSSTDAVAASKEN